MDVMGPVSAGFGERRAAARRNDLDRLGYGSPMGNYRGSITVAVALVLVAWGVFLAVPSDARETGPLDSATAPAGNPFVDGWYADPGIAHYDGLYWVYPTSSLPYDEQTSLDAFSSPDLIRWTRHPQVLTTASVPWAHQAMWAPSPIERNGKFYLYFSANDIQSDAETGGIGVAVADRPEGPYHDALGHPLIATFVNGAQPIDPDVFLDGDGQAYLYYGGHGHANAVKLNPDMTSVDGGFQEITPPGYVEGAQMFKRAGEYYLMWSEGDWKGPGYSVAYAKAGSPTGPFRKAGTVLRQDPAVATGPGHNSVLNVPGTDIWYLFYHRRPLGETDADHRVLAYDRMTFNPDGTIKPVTMGVRDDFGDGNALGWEIYGGNWQVTNQRRMIITTAPGLAGGKAMLNTDFTDLVYDAGVTVTESGSDEDDSAVTVNDSDGNAGIVFRATWTGLGIDQFHGYYAGLDTTGRLVLGRSNGHLWTPLGSSPYPVARGTQYHLRVTATGPTISVYVNNMVTPELTVVDSKYTHGTDGVRAVNVSAAFGSISIARP
jgi:hypothetical protein